MIVQAEDNMSIITNIIASVVMATDWATAFATSISNISPFKPQTTENDTVLIGKSNETWRTRLLPSHPYTMNASPSSVLLSVVVIGVPFGMVSRTAPSSDVLQENEGI